MLITEGSDEPPHKSLHICIINFQSNISFFFFNLSGVSFLQETATGNWCNTNLRDSDVLKRERGES